MLAGPAVGGRLAERSAPLCFLISSGLGAFNILLLGLSLPETRDRSAVGGGSVVSKLQAVNPVSFLKLFRAGRPLAKLTLACGISEMCDGTTEVDRYYAQDVAGLSLSQNGLFASMRGLAMIVGGRRQPHAGAGALLPPPPRALWGFNRTGARCCFD